jgi:hypothetical protein
MCAPGRKRPGGSRAANNGVAHRASSPRGDETRPIYPCSWRHRRFGSCFPVCDAGGVGRYVGSLNLSSFALLMESRMIPFAEDGGERRPVA